MNTTNLNSIPFKDEDGLDSYYSAASEYAVDIEDLIDYTEGRKFETVKEVGHAFEDETFVGWEYARDIDVFKRLRNIGCRSIGVSNTVKPTSTNENNESDNEITKNSELVGLINNEEFYGAVTLKTLNAEKEYMDYVLKYGY